MKSNKNTMTQLPIRQFSSDNSQIMADLVSIQQDLGLVIQFIDELIKRFSDKDNGKLNDDFISYSLWISALICYARCFSSGARVKIDANIYSHLCGDPLGAHKFFIDMRNKQIAHSVNAYEQTKIGVVTSEKDSSFSILGIAQLSARHVFCDIDGCSQLRGLALEAYKHASDRIKKMDTKIICEVKRADVDIIKKSDILGYTAPSSDMVGVRR